MPENLPSEEKEDPITARKDEFRLQPKRIRMRVNRNESLRKTIDCSRQESSIEMESVYAPKMPVLRGDKSKQDSFVLQKAPSLSQYVDVAI